MFCFFFQAEDGIRDSVASRGLGDVYKRQELHYRPASWPDRASAFASRMLNKQVGVVEHGLFLDLVKTVVVGTTHGPELSLIHI